MAPGQVTLMKQGKVPALTSNAGAINMASAYVIDAKPHGHGDVHSLLYSTGTAQRWSDSGVKWVNFFQDTNALALYTMPAMLGVSLELGE
jgi:UDP-sugar pyrophosphorylase